MKLADSVNAEELDALLPQTQCTRCGYPGCLPYAQAMAQGRALPNRCAPGGTAVIEALSARLGLAPQALADDCGPAMPRRIAWIDPAACIGCVKCIQACPVDAIIGAPKRMHTVIAAHCTGCELCVAPCPVDSIQMLTPAAAQHDWSLADANAARERHLARQRRQQAAATDRARRLEAVRVTTERVEAIDRSAIVAAAMQRARARLAEAPR